MIRKLLAVGAIAVSTLLGACDQTTQQTQQQIEQVIAQVQQTTQQVCGFLPVATTVTGIIGTMAGIPQIAIANEVATQICNAVRTQALKSTRRLGSLRPGVNYSMGSVNGVEIVGRFTR